MAEFIVTTQTLLSKAEELTKMNTDLKEKTDGLNGLVASLDSVWEGEAHDEFKVAYDKSRIALDKLSIELSKYCVALSDISNDYAKTEANNIQIAQS